ncbi:DNA-directed RNA polymerase I subunit RPA2-like [Uloborus diversus]|uniref:DNA-directed RNA polymerase I subunit RPA2-like n=1 Tax=Uloborus diversus TaxID=327109 RepID=UPI00240A34AD|nr:DNA-directed RNA polymerase I subunit RPA2-like [Uloborus diversus]
MFKQKFSPNYIRLISHFHIDSFNFVIRKGLSSMCLDLDPLYTDTDIPVKISISNAEMTQLDLPMDGRRNKRTVYPSEARIRKWTYYAQLKLQLKFQIGEEIEYAERVFYAPLMLKSDLCYLSVMNDEQLEKVKEDCNDPGGYFIINGTERMMYLFLVPKRNYNMTIHFVNDSTYEVRFFYKRRSYCVPFMLLVRALVAETDLSVVESILHFVNDISFKQSLVQMLRNLHSNSIHSQRDAKNFMGQLFLKVSQLPSITPLNEVADHVLHFCVSKLFCFVHQKCIIEDPENIVYQEILSPGQIYLIIMKEGINFFLNSVKRVMLRKMKDSSFKFNRDTVHRCCNQAISFSAMVKSMIATGNIPAKAHGFYSDTGYTVPLKRRNVLSVISQYTRVSKFSMEFCSKNARKFYAESWGFLCPAQTPEGEKCGLVNHLASGCQIVSMNAKSIEWTSFYKKGVLKLNDPMLFKNVSNIPVIVDGTLIGFIDHCIVNKFINYLNCSKIFCIDEIPSYSEVLFLSKDNCGSALPALYVYSSPCRIMRIVKNKEPERIFLLGCFEQQFNELLSYEEVNSHCFLGLSACFMPFSEYNPGVRNIFSCVSLFDPMNSNDEKSVQGISVPFINWSSRTDVEASFLINYQAPLVSSSIAESYGIDSYPLGTNVHIAILSYTGFDMEDAIVLNKSCIERGLMRHITNRTVSFSFDDLALELKSSKVGNVILLRDSSNQNLENFLDIHGLPYIGRLISRGDPILSAYSTETRTFVIKTYEISSPAYVQSVRVMDVVPSNILPKQEKKVSVTFTSVAVPEIGDKFSNRHAQKGICSYLMPHEDLPFTEDGLVPDLIFNPHGMPSRMSIGMYFEMMASKSASVKGSKYIFEPFKYSTSSKLQGNFSFSDGFEYYGTEKLYSGTSGEVLEAEVFCGFVYCLRLHHLVEQKYQVRSIGPTEEHTQQPLYESRSGAIRVGEMEKDAILSHGSSELIADRLLHNSDKCTAFICSRCKQILFPVLQHILQESVSHLEKNDFCKMCRLRSTVKVEVPYVLMYLIAELCVLGIKIKFSI